jgi:hypothetical protein
MLVFGGILKEEACNSDFKGANKKGSARSTLNLVNLVNRDFQRG